MTQIERTGDFIFIFMYHNHVLNDCKCEDSNDGAFVVWFCCCFNTKKVAAEYSYRLLQCCDPQFRLFDP